jgi:hypothetical protein
MAVELCPKGRSYCMSRVWSERIGEAIEEFMRKSLSRFRDAVCPIFFTPTNDSRTHCIASCVLLRLAGHHFLLTAAHVTDQRRFGSLSIPGRHGNPGLSGDYAGMRLPSSGDRRNDRYDIAYIRLTAGTVEALHPTLKFFAKEYPPVTNQGCQYHLLGS